MALDLLLAMIVLLVALASFTPILERFQDTQSQVSLSQQLRANAHLSALFISDSVNQFRVQSNYPATATLAGGALLPSRWAPYTHFSGSLPLSPVRGLYTAQGFDCTAVFDSTAHTLTLTIPKSDAGTDDDAAGTRSIAFAAGYPQTAVQFTGCFAPLVITEGP